MVKYTFEVTKVASFGEKIVETFSFMKTNDGLIETKMTQCRGKTTVTENRWNCISAFNRMKVVVDAYKSFGFKDVKCRQLSVAR